MDFRCTKKEKKKRKTPNISKSYLVRHTMTLTSSLGSIFRSPCNQYENHQNVVLHTLQPWPLAPFAWGGLKSQQRWSGGQWPSTWFNTEMVQVRSCCGVQEVCICVDVGWQRHISNPQPCTPTQLWAHGSTFIFFLVLFHIKWFHGV